jgi:hypothetical protein
MPKGRFLMDIKHKELLLDVCPVCSAKNIHILADMCGGCEAEMEFRVHQENNIGKAVDYGSQTVNWVDSYFFLNNGVGY